MKKTLLITATIILTGCVSAKFATPSQTDVDRVKTTYPNYTLADLTQGENLYKQHCGLCHKLQNPTSQTEEGWKKIVPPMVSKCNKKENITMSTNDQESILRYVITMSKASAKK